MQNLSFQPDFGRAFKYQFDVQLHSLDMQIPFPCYIQISWRRKNKSISTKQKFEVKGNEKEFKFTEKLSMISTCYYDSKTMSFKDKSSVLTLIIYINNVPKSGGQTTINLTSILNPIDTKDVYSKTMTCPLDKCPIKNSSLTFTLEGCYLQQMQQQTHNRSISMNSEISSLYAKSFTDSNFSLNFGKEPPSKDCSSSVRDITNMLKLESRIDISNKKRSDSASCYGPTQNTIETNQQSKKSIGLKSHVEIGKSNVSEYMLPPKKEDKLREEKYRLEAQNTQLKIYNQEQNVKLDQQIRQISELRSQLQNHSSHSFILRSQVGKLQDQLYSKELKESELQLKLSDTTSLQKYIAQLQSELSNFKELYDRTLLDNQILKQECQSMNKHLFSLQTQKNNHKLQSEQVYNRLKEKESIIENNKLQIERFYNEKNESMKNRYEYQSRIREYEGEIEHLTNQRNKERNINLQKTSSSKQIQNSLSLLSEKLRTLEMEIRNKECRIGELENSDRIQRGNLEALENIKNNLERQLQYSTEDLNKKNQNVDVLMNIKSKHEHQIMILAKQLEEYKNKESEITRLKQRILKLEEQIKGVKESEGRSMESIRVFKEDNYKLQQEGNLKSKTIETLKSEYEGLRGEISQLHSQLQQHKNNQNMQQQASHQRIVQQLQHRIQTIFTEKTAIQKSYDELLETNIQLQIQTKMLSNTNSSIKNHQLQQLRRQIVVQKSNLTECEEQISTLEQQLKEKTRSLAIEIEKNKMYTEENQMLQDTLIERNTHLDIEKEKCEVLESNIRSVEERNDEILNQNRLYREKVEILQLSLVAVKKESKGVKEYEGRVRQLEEREVEKIKILEQLNSSLFKSNNVIKELNKTLEVQGFQLNNKDKLIRQLQSKLICNEEFKKKSNEVCTLTSENRNILKKNELLFKQICQLKQQLQASEQEKSNQNNGELLQKVQTMQNQLNKREDKIKKLEKENTKLEEENIQLNIKIMKELSELHKKQEGIKSEYSKTLKVLSDSQS